MDEQAALTPAQQRVMTELMAPGEPRPRFGPEVADQLRAALEEGLGPVAASLDEPLWVKKGSLSRVHACEAHFQAEEDSFAWNVHTARGTVVHRALELLISARHHPAPLEVIDHAIATLAARDHRHSPRPWLEEASALEISDLRARANEIVVKFLECWPPLPPSWSPRTETGIRTALCGERIVLSGRVDVALGQARGDVARGLIVDLKTGGSHGGHLDDLRFYALVQTLRVGVPPFRVATYYLDSATFRHEDVTVEILEAAVRRTVDGAGKMAELRAGRPPSLSPGPPCGYCRLRTDCEGAVAYRNRNGDSLDDV